MGKRINQYPEQTAPVESDLALGWRTSEGKVVKLPLTGVVNLARSSQAVMLYSDPAFGPSAIALPWNAAPLTLAQIIPAPPAALTVELYRADGSVTTVTRANGAWVADGGAAVISPGYLLNCTGFAGSFTVNLRLLPEARPRTLTVPASATWPNGVMVTNPLRRARGVREVFAAIEILMPAGVGIAVQTGWGAAIWQNGGALGYDSTQFMVAPGMFMNVFNNSGEAVELKWNYDDWDLYREHGGSYEGEPGIYMAGRDPNVGDYATFKPGMIWINTSTTDAFLCVFSGEDSGTWRKITLT